MPLFIARKEVFGWLKSGAKNIDVRKGMPRKGEVAIFQSGATCLEFQIVNKETCTLTKGITLENFCSIIPSSQSLEEAFSYLEAIYRTGEGVYTAYYLAPQKKK